MRCHRAAKRRKRGSRSLRRQARRCRQALRLGSHYPSRSAALASLSWAQRLLLCPLWLLRPRRLSASPPSQQTTGNTQAGTASGDAAAGPGAMPAAKRQRQGGAGSTHGGRSSSSRGSQDYDDTWVEEHATRQPQPAEPISSKDVGSIWAESTWVHAVVGCYWEVLVQAWLTAFLTLSRPLSCLGSMLSA